MRRSSLNRSYAALCGEGAALTSGGTAADRGHRHNHAIGIIIGRGRLIADTTVEEFTARAGGSAVTVRTPQAARLRELLPGPDVTVTSDDSGVLHVRGLTAEQIGAAAWQARLPVFELATRHASLEEAFMRLTDASVDFRSHDAAEAVAAR